jgi:hypothetical protein
LEDLATATKNLLAAGLQPEKAPRKDFLNILQKSSNTKDWFPDHHGPSTRDLRLNTHLGAEGIMTPGRIQDPEGAKTIVVSFKSAVGAITTIQRQTLRFVCYSNTNIGRLKIDMASTTGGKHNPSLLGRRVMLIYKSHMHPESSLDPEHCTPKLDAKARSIWLHNHNKIDDQYEDVYSPETNEGDTYMKKDPIPTEVAAAAKQGHPPSGT